MKLKRILTIFSILCVIIFFVDSQEKILKFFGNNGILATYPIAEIDSIKVGTTDANEKSLKIHQGNELSELSVANIDSIKIEEIDTVALKEREALIAIYNALGGDNWINNENWCSDKPVSEWYGVSVQNNNVFGLDLRLNNLIGVIPDEIGKLKKLHYLMFDDYGINAMSDEIYSLSELNSLTLDNTTIPEISYKINNLKKLGSLALQSNVKIKFPTDLKGLASLLHLNVKNIYSMDAICDIKSLEWLSIVYNDSLCVSPKIGNLTSLKQLDIHGCKIIGEIPSSIGRLKKLKSLDLRFITVKCGIPSEIGELTELEKLFLYGTSFYGEIPPELGNLENLQHFEIGRNYNMQGVLPQEIIDLPICKKMWPSFFDYTGLDLTHCVFNAPDFIVDDLNGEIVNSESLYKNHKLIVFYIWNSWCVCSDEWTMQIMKLYEEYKDNDDVYIIGYCNQDSNTASEEIAKLFVMDNAYPWQNVFASCDGWTWKNKILDYTISPMVCIFDENKKVVFNTYANSLENLHLYIQKYLNDHDYYTSTDYSTDGMVTTLQTASVGEGIDIVLMGDAYSDRQIADGTYAKDMEYIYDNLFTEEPYKSFKDHFNVHYVNVVSATEGYEYGNTALDSYFGEGTFVGGNDNAVFTYAQKAISANDMDEALIIVAMNSDNYAGTCYMYYPTYSTGTFGSGVSVAYFPKGGDESTFAQLLHHEACGHGFAKLADEYAYEDMGIVPNDYESQIKEQQAGWGWWKNVDFTSDLNTIRWSHFLNDTRYANEGLGAFEGGLTYWNGVWRPTENSIMRYNTGGFNAPSREAIYYRIHKLAYGDDWQYDYEKFVEWDAKNRTAAANAARMKAKKPANYKPTHPPVIVNKSWKDAK